MTKSTTRVRKLPPLHVAPYSDYLMTPMEEMLRQWLPRPANGRKPILLDIFAGTGHKFAAMAGVLGATPIGIEIEPAYLTEAHECVQLGNSKHLPFVDEVIDGGATSPAYPNGVTDNFRANDLSRRNTYIHRIRAHFGPSYELHPDNMGGTSARRSVGALETFLAIQDACIAELYRVLRVGAPYIWNGKDTPKIPYLALTWEQLERHGFRIVEHRAIEAHGLPEGENYDVRAEVEDLTVAIKVGDPRTAAPSIPFPRP